MSNPFDWWGNAAARFPRITAAQEIELAAIIQKWLADPDPSPQLRRRGERARKRFIEANLRLVISIVRKQIRTREDKDAADMLQEGIFGLIKAVEKFDPTRGYKFSTYAYWWIYQSISRWHENHSGLMKLPQLLHRNIHKLDPVTRELIAELGRKPTDDEIAAAMGVSTDVLRIMRYNRGLINSLDAPAGGEATDTSVGDMIAAPEDPDREHLAELSDMIGRLPPDLGELLRDAYGLEGRPQLSRRRLADREGCSTENIRKRLLAAHHRLRMMGAHR